MKKRSHETAAVLCILAVLLGLFPFLASSAVAEGKEEIVCGHFVYQLRDDGTAEITRYDGEMHTSISIPDHLDGIPVSSIGDGAFNQFFLDHITIPSGVKYIGALAFAFNDITEITIPEGVEEIGTGAFNYCGDLKRAVLPDTLHAVGDSVFAHCRELTDISVSSDHPFLKMEDGGLYSREDNRLICYAQDTRESFTIPDGTEIIGNYAFQAAGHTAVVVIPASVVSIGPYSFAYATSLKEILVSPDNPVYQSVDGVLFDASADTLIRYPGASENSSYSVPEGTKTIWPMAFFGCSDLKEVVIPDSVSEIGEDLFGISILNNMNDQKTDLIVTVTKGSYAEEYCRENHIPYSFTISDNGFLLYITAPVIIIGAIIIFILVNRLRAAGSPVFNNVHNQRKGTEKMHPEPAEAKAASIIGKSESSGNFTPNFILQLDSWLKDGIIDKNEYKKLKERFLETGRK